VVRSLGNFGANPCGGQGEQAGSPGVGLGAIAGIPEPAGAAGRDAHYHEEHEATLNPGGFSSLLGQD
jgi:hypothetical protein